MVSGFNISGVVEVEVTAAKISALSNPRSMEENMVGRYNGVYNSSFYKHIHFDLCNKYSYVHLLGIDILWSTNVCGGGLGLSFI